MMTAEYESFQCFVYTFYETKAKGSLDFLKKNLKIDAHSCTLQLQRYILRSFLFTTNDSLFYKHLVLFFHFKTTYILSIRWSKIQHVCHGFYWIYLNWVMQFGYKNINQHAKWMEWISIQLFPNTNSRKIKHKKWKISI